MPTLQDSVQRFYFDDCHARGEIVQLHHCYKEASRHQNLDLSLKQLLGEFFAAATLLTGLLKFDGKVTLQAQGEGPIKLVMADSNHQRDIRGIVRKNKGYNPSACEPTSLRSLLGKATLSLTLDPKDGQRYQGIIPLEHDSLANNLSAYFLQSEQLSTFVHLCADNTSCAGLLLQELPTNSTDHKQRQSWETAECLAKTSTNEELLHLPKENMLHRLFAELQTRIEKPQNVAFRCSCSRQKSRLAIAALGQQDAYELLAERDIISSYCEFCGRDYSFAAKDLDTLFETQPSQH